MRRRTRLLLADQENVQPPPTTHRKPPTHPSSPLSRGGNGLEQQSPASPAVAAGKESPRVRSRTNTRRTVTPANAAAAKSSAASPRQRTSGAAPKRGTRVSRARKNSSSVPSADTPKTTRKPATAASKQGQSKSRRSDQRVDEYAQAAPAAVAPPVPSVAVWDELIEVQNSLRAEPQNAATHAWVDDEQDGQDDGNEENRRMSVVSVSDLPPTPHTPTKRELVEAFRLPDQTQEQRQLQHREPLSHDRQTASFGGSPRSEGILSPERSSAASPSGSASPQQPDSLPTCAQLAADNPHMPFIGTLTQQPPQEGGDELPPFLRGPVAPTLRLPSQLNRLLNLFMSVERTVQQRRLKCLPMFLNVAPPGTSSFLKAASRAARVLVSQDALRQMVWLCPHLLQIEWALTEDLERNKVYDLELLQLPGCLHGRPLLHCLSAQATQQRKECFKLACYRWVFLHQSEFLASKGIPVAPLSLLADWHPEYSTTTVPPLPLAAFPLRKKPVPPCSGRTDNFDVSHVLQQQLGTPTRVRSPESAQQLEFHTPRSSSSGAARSDAVRTPRGKNASSLWQAEGLGSEHQRTPFTAMGKLMQKLSLRTPPSAKSATLELTPGQTRLLTQAQSRKKHKDAAAALQSTLNQLAAEIQEMEDASAVLGAMANTFLCSGALPFMSEKNLVQRLEASLQSKVPGITTARIIQGLQVIDRHTEVVKIVRQEPNNIVKLSRDGPLVQAAKATLLRRLDQTIADNERQRQESITKWLAAQKQRASDED